jgi:late competence protein required for DNA uptake (superfamily II DNA/RNA helicase)
MRSLQGKSCKQSFAVLNGGQLEKKLADDRHAAQVATESLRHIEREIAVKTTGLKFLESRAEKFAKSAIIEASGRIARSFFASSRSSTT